MWAAQRVPSLLPCWAALFSAEISELPGSLALAPYLLGKSRRESAFSLVAVAEDSQGRFSLVCSYHMAIPEPITMAQGVVNGAL